jgi:hypothetical protein
MRILFAPRNWRTDSEGVVISSRSKTLTALNRVFSPSNETNTIDNKKEVNQTSLLLTGLFRENASRNNITLRIYHVTTFSTCLLGHGNESLVISLVYVSPVVSPAVSRSIFSNRRTREGGDKGQALEGSYRKER